MDNELYSPTITIHDPSALIPESPDDLRPNSPSEGVQLLASKRVYVSIDLDIPGVTESALQVPLPLPEGVGVIYLLQF